MSYLTNCHISQIAYEQFSLQIVGPSKLHAWVLQHSVHPLNMVFKRLTLR